MPLWGKTDELLNKPKFLKTDASGTVTEGPAKGKKLVFIDEVEAKLPDNKAKGITGAGWYLIQKKGSRLLVELVVAISDAKRVVNGQVKDASDAAEDLVGLDSDDQ
jgi:hypothetical protein